MKKVVKFGGSSLASAKQFKKVGDIIRSDKARRYVVPSAPGKRSKTDEKVTDMLYACYDAASTGASYGKIFSKIKERYEATVSALKIQSLLGRNIFSMSGGEKQSLAFASVYAMNPSVFVLDEPTANLDADAIDTLRQQIIQIKKEGRTVVIELHPICWTV